MDYTNLVQYLQVQETAMIDVLKELVEHESPSTDKTRLDQLARRLRDRFEKIGAMVTVLANPTHSDHLRAIFSTEGVAFPVQPALILCHFDTVWPVGTLATRPFRVEHNKIWGPGVLDMKASIVLVEFALRAISNLGLPLPRPVVLLLTSDEEIGSPTSRSVIEEYAQEAEYVLVLEMPLPGGVLKTARKGVGYFKVEIEGRAAHAGIEPEKGVSAIEELAHQVLYLQSLNNPSQESTVNVGVVRGGTRPNVVSDSAAAEVDVRVWNMTEANRIENAILHAVPRNPGTKLKVTGKFKRPPMERSAEIAKLFQRAQSIGHELGVELQEGSTGGGSDGNFSAAMGIPTLDGLGALGDGAHADHEHIRVDSLASRAMLLTALLLHL